MCKCPTISKAIAHEKTPGKMVSKAARLLGSKHIGFNKALTNNRGNLKYKLKMTKVNKTKPPLSKNVKIPM
jgi:hypothetical protein